MVWSLKRVFPVSDVSLSDVCMCLCIHTHIYKIVHAQSLSRVQLFVTPWTAVHQAPLSMEFFTPGHRSGLPFPTPGDLTSPGIEPMSPALAGGFFTISATWEALMSQIF